MKLRRTTWVGAGAVALAVPAMFFSRRFARFLFEHHDDALFVLQWMPGVGALLGSLAPRRGSAPPPPPLPREAMPGGPVRGSPNAPPPRTCGLAAGARVCEAT